MINFINSICFFVILTAESAGWEWESDGCQFSTHHRDNHTHSAVDSGVCKRITSVYKDTPRGSDYVTQGKYNM